MTVKTRGTATQAARRTGTVVILRPTTTSHPAILGKGRHSNIQGCHRARATHPTTHQARALLLAMGTHPPLNLVIRVILEVLPVDRNSTLEDTLTQAGLQVGTLTEEGHTEDIHLGQATLGRQEVPLLLLAQPRHPHTLLLHNPTSNTRRVWALGMGRPLGPVPTQAPWPPRVPG